MATVFSRKHKTQKGHSYPVYYRHPVTKKVTYSCTMFSRADATAKENELRAQIDGGDIPETPKERKMKAMVTFGEVGKKCEKEWNRRGKEGSLASDSVAGYLHLMHNMHKVWGKAPIRTITKDMILNLRADLAQRLVKVKSEDGKSEEWVTVQSPAHSNRHLFIIKQAFQKAVEEGVIKHDPSKDIGYLSEKVHERKVFLMPAQLDLLIAQAAKGRSKHYMPLAILLAAEHGCSRQEILDLTWDKVDLDFEGKGAITFFRTKNKVERLQWIMPRTRQALIERKAHLDKMREKRGIKVKANHVIGWLDGTPFGDIKTTWGTIREACGYDDLHFHDGRHTYCSNIILGGGSAKLAGASIGHRDLRSTNRYINLEGLRDNPAQDILEARYDDYGETA